MLLTWTKNRVSCFLEKMKDYISGNSLVEFFNLEFEVSANVQLWTPWSMACDLLDWDKPIRKQLSNNIIQHKVQTETESWIYHLSCIGPICFCAIGINWLATTGFETDTVVEWEAETS
jgi:hypothetical protein